MKILVVTNLYPPYYLGGYELRCAQVAEGLRRTGHDVRVLTGVYGLPLSVLHNIQPRTEEISGVCVHRWLNQYAYGPQPFRRPWTLFQAHRELYDARQFVKLLASFGPDIVNWWSMSGLSKTLLPLPQSLGIPNVHCIDDPWMVREYGPGGEEASRFWTALWEGNWGPRLCRPLLRWIGKRWEKRVEREGIPTRRLSCQPNHVCFVSEFLGTFYREAGLEFRSSEVVHAGVPTGQFYHPCHRERSQSEPLRILYSGQISPDRGLHTAVESIGLVPAHLRPQLTFSIAGHSSSTYFAQVRRRVEALGLGDRVVYLGKVPHENMPRVYSQHDVLVFPSTRPEGLPLTMVEAMLAGCAVLTTGSGGAMEIATLASLPLFPKDDPVALSRLLVQFISCREDVSQVALRGQIVALREFGLDRMLGRWVATLERLVAENASLHACGNSGNASPQRAQGNPYEVAADQ